jgi:chemotaxis protein MotB
MIQTIHTHTLTMKSYYPITLAVLLCVQSACVKKQLYYSEKLAHSKADGQVTALSKELFDRKTEAAKLIKEVGELNRLLGVQQKEVTDLQAELAKRTATLGASSERLIAEKTTLEMKLEATAKTLEDKEAQLSKLRSKQSQLDGTIATDIESLTTALAALNGHGYSMLPQQDHLEVTVEDQILFDRDGVRLSTSASGFLYGFAQYLAERPAYKVQIHAHVDNTLPNRQREITDSWAFAQVRALQIVRTLVSSYNVNAYMLAPVARGEYAPVSTNGTPEGRAENRRTVFYIYPN